MQPLLDPIRLPADQPKLQAAGGKELHDEIRVRRVFHNGIDSDDVGVCQFPAYLRLVEKKAAMFGAAGLFRQQHFHGKVPVAGQLDDFPYLACLAGHHQVSQPITADDLRGHG